MNVQGMYISLCSLFTFPVYGMWALDAVQGTLASMKAEMCSYQKCVSVFVVLSERPKRGQKSAFLPKIVAM